MKIVGLITEYNPFHNGHLYHIQKAREITGADAVIVAMSGDYVQRGVPAIAPKHLRAQMALESGAAVVLELPVSFAAGSAEYFAAGAIALFDSLGCVDSVCFGSECGDLEILKKIARILTDEPQEYKFFLQELLRRGNAFPRARQMALQKYLGNLQTDAVLEQPNNILGIEYIKALYQNRSSIKPYTIQRIASGYHDTQMSDRYSSASAIRYVLSDSSESLERLKDQMPPSCLKLLQETFDRRCPVYADDFSLLLKYRLLSETKDTFKKYLDITEDLANRMMKHSNDFLSFSQFCNLLKTKDITYSRISRCLLHLLLSVTNEDMEAYQSAGYCQYARILGFRKSDTELLTLLKKSAQVPLLTKLTQTDGLSEIGLRMLQKDIFAADLYESVLCNKFGIPFINEYQQQIVRV